MIYSKFKSLYFMVFLTLTLAGFGIVLQPSMPVFAGDASGVTASLSDILKNQQPDGGWRKYYSETHGEWSKSSIDNKATYTEIRRLTKAYGETKDWRYSAAAVKGIYFLLNMQYDNGGWPQVYQSSGYHQHITFNDDAMINVAILLDEIANKKGDFSFIDSNLAEKCKKAVSKSVECLLKTQVVSNGKLTVWGQQHDSKTLAPAGARAYEVPSLCANESVGIVEFLKTRNATPQISASIRAAEEWFRTVGIIGIRVVKTSDDVIVIYDPSVTKPIWARFYELGTNKPIFVGRDGIVKYRLCDIERERRVGYGWYGKWPLNIVQ